MIYGYAVLKEMSYTNGKPAWREDAREKVTVVDKVRLFASEKERNNAIQLEIRRLDKRYNIFVVPFKTKGSQGELIISTQL